MANKNKIWVAVISHEYGTDVYGARTKRYLYKKLYAFVKEWWEGDLKCPLPEGLTEKQVIEKYFLDVYDTSHPCHLEFMGEIDLGGRRYK